jgi:hypothetical protein
MELTTINECPKDGSKMNCNAITITFRVISKSPCQWLIHCTVIIFNITCTCARAHTHIHTYIHSVTWHLKARITQPEQMFIDRQWLCKEVHVATNKQATTVVLFRYDDESQASWDRTLGVSWDSKDDWVEMATSSVETWNTRFQKLNLPPNKKV